MSAATSEESLQAIMQALKLQGEAISALLARQSASATTSEALVPPTQQVVSHNLTFEFFDPSEEDFLQYIERLENFMSLRGVTNAENTKKNILLGCLRREQYKQLAALTAPEKPSDKTYVDLIKILEKRFDPITYIHTERHKFLSRTQGKTESLTSYIQALKIIAQKCKWTCPSNECNQTIDSIFQAQFIRGIRDNFIREKILSMQPNATLEETLQNALAIEAAHKQNVEDYSSVEQHHDNVHKVTSTHSYNH